MICVFQCQIPFTDDDVVILNAKDEDLELMTKRMEIRQAANKKSKEKKSKVKQEAPAENSTVDSEKVSFFWRFLLCFKFFYFLGESKIGSVDKSHQW